MFPQDEWMQIWTPRNAGLYVRWFAIIVTEDSISGIPSTIADPGRACDGCRQSLPLSVVDSMRVYHQATLITREVRQTVIFAAILAIPIGLLVYLCEHPDENGKKTCLK